MSQKLIGSAGHVVPLPCKSICVVLLYLQSVYCCGLPSVATNPVCPVWRPTRSAQCGDQPGLPSVATNPVCPVRRPTWPAQCGDQPGLPSAATNPACPVWRPLCSVQQIFGWACFPASSSPHLGLSLYEILC